MAQVPTTDVTTISVGGSAYTVPFLYQNQAEVFVEVDGVATAFTWINSGNISITPAPVAGAKVRRYRSTAATSIRHDFRNGVPFTPKNITENNDQLLYVVQEAVNDTAGTADAALTQAEQAVATADAAAGRVDVAVDLIDAALQDSALYLRNDLANATDPAKGAGMVGFRQAGADAVGRTLLDKVREVVSVKDFGAVGDGVTDDTAAFQKAVNSGKPIIDFGGTYRLNTPVFVPKNLPSNSWFVFIGAGRGTKLILGPGNSTAFSQPSVSPGDFVRNISLSSFDVDSSLALGVDGAAILGGRVNGSEATMGLNWENIYVSDVQAYGIETDNTNTKFRQSIHISSQFSSVADTPTVIKNIRISDVRAHGGKNGIFIGAGVPGSNDAPCFMDEVHIANFEHDTLDPNATYPAAGIQLGQGAYGGRVRIKNAVIKNGGDVAIELNAWMDAVVEDVVYENCGTGLWSYNYHRLADYKKQRVVWRNCTARNTRNNPAIRIGATDAGHFLVENFAFASEANGEVRIIDFASGTLESLQSLTIRNLTSYVRTAERSDYMASLTGQLSLHLNSDYKLVIDNANFTYEGTSPRPEAINASIIINSTAGSPTNVYATIRDVTVADKRAGTLNMSDLLHVTGASAISGSIERCSVKSTVSGTKRGIRVGASSAPAPDLEVRNCDFSGCTSLFELSTSVSAQRNNVLFHNTRFAADEDAVTQPSNPSVGASPFTWKNTKGFPVRCTVSGGTVSEVAVSQNGTTFYPTGFTAGTVLLMPNETLRITHTVAPALRVVVLRKIIG